MNKKSVCFTWVFFSLLFLTQCNLRSPYSKSISIVKANFSDTLSSHFPANFNGEYRIKFVSPDRCRSNGECGAFLITEFTCKQKESLQGELQKMNIASTKFNLKLNFVVNKDTSDIVYVNDLDTIKTNLINSIPIPNFPQIINESKLLIPQDKIDINDLDIYILSGSPGKFIDSAFLTFGKGLPNEWRNGYTKGIAIGRKSSNVIYWFEIW